VGHHSSGIKNEVRELGTGWNFFFKERTAKEHNLGYPGWK
jgi:hypothetical protein